MSTKALLLLDPATLIPKSLLICCLAIVSVVGAPPLGAQTAAEAFGAGRAAVLAGDYDNAIPQLERAVELNESNADYHYWLGRAVYEAAPRASKLRMPGMARRVRNEWERAVTLDGNQVDARAGLAEWYAMAPGFMGGDKAKAREQASEIAKRNPMRGAMARGVIASHEDNWPAEVEAYQQAIVFAPDTAAAYVALADEYARTNRIDSAFVTIARYASRRPTDPWRLYYFGRFAGSTGQRLEEGEQALRQFLGAPPPALTAAGLSRARYWLGKIAERRGNRQLAGEQYQSALQANPANYTAKQALEALK
ncbi:MAG: tetratricopeptide repeat protein [Gemmatimonadaceae bacterium]